MNSWLLKRNSFQRFTVFIHVLTVNPMVDFCKQKIDLYNCSEKKLENHNYLSYFSVSSETQNPGRHVGVNGWSNGVSYCWVTGVGTTSRPHSYQHSLAGALQPIETRYSQLHKTTKFLYYHLS